jgi:hypothetical protein
VAGISGGGDFTSKNAFSQVLYSQYSRLKYSVGVRISKNLQQSLSHSIVDMSQEVFSLVVDDRSTSLNTPPPFILQQDPEGQQGGEQVALVFCL